MTAAILAVLDDQELLGTRYPALLDGPDGPVVVRSGSPAELTDPMLAAVVLDTRDGADARAVLDSHAAVLVGVEALAALGGGVAGSDDAGRLVSTSLWLPFLPARRAVDVDAATRLIATGAIGTPTLCELTTYVGRVTADSGWEQDAPFARSALEALVFGLDLIETLLGGIPTTTSWSPLPGYDLRGGIARHTGGPPVVQTVLPARLGAAPLFTATVVGEHGRLLLRHEFAPGAVTVWDARAQAFRSPALQRMKHSVQAPDTALGGVEAAAALDELLHPRAGAEDARRQAVRLVDHAVTALRSGDHDPAREDPA